MGHLHDEKPPVYSTHSTQTNTSDLTTPPIPFHDAYELIRKKENERCSKIITTINNKITAGKRRGSVIVTTEWWGGGIDDKDVDSAVNALSRYFYSAGYSMNFQKVIDNDIFSKTHRSPYIYWEIDVNKVNEMGVNKSKSNSAHCILL